MTKKALGSTNSEVASLTLTLKGKLQNAKQHFFGHTLQKFIENSPDKFWRYMSVKRATPAASSAEEDKIKANNFSSYFFSVFSTDNNVKIPESSTHVGRGGSLLSLSITAPGIVSLLLQLHEKKSSGPYDIPNSFLKRYAELISRYLHLIFTKSIRDGRLPVDWKIAKVVPVHKSGDSSAPSKLQAHLFDMH